MPGQSLVFTSTLTSTSTATTILSYVKGDLRTGNQRRKQPSGCVLDKARVGTWSPPDAQLLVGLPCLQDMDEVLQVVDIRWPGEESAHGPDEVHGGRSDVLVLQDKHSMDRACGGATEAQASWPPRSSASSGS